MLYEYYEYLYHMVYVLVVTVSVTDRLLFGYVYSYVVQVLYHVRRKTEKQHSVDYSFYCFVPTARYR